MKLRVVFGVKVMSILLTMLIVSSSCTKDLDSATEEFEITTLRLAHSLDVSHPVHKGMEYMAKRARELSDGNLRIKIYPSSQLGSERECLEMLQIGSLAMTKVSSAVMQSFVPEYKALGMPYIFRDLQHYHKVLDGPIGEKILNSGTEYWLQGLVFYDAGSRSFYTIDKPIRKPSDLKGMKIRVMQSMTSVKMVQAMGGSPTPISWGELYTALQNGVVDGAENNLPSLHTSHQYEVADYFSMNKHTSIPDVLLMSTHILENLSEQEKQWLQQAADESVEKQREYWQEAQKEALKVIKEAGVEVIRPDPEPFRESVQSVYSYIERTSPEVYKLTQQIQNVEVSDSEDK
ncbi:MAG: TRAP transporter substrate-binding protein [Bacteroidales bacterium]|nr:TRAP transporter substrate-binding protein [Bacteroidales bacterium]